MTDETKNPLQIPEEGMIGLARDFADLYSTYLEPPKAFFYFSYLTYIGAQVAKMVTLDSTLHPEPRLYTVVLGESADDRKSTALTMTKEFFSSLGDGLHLPVLLGVGSAEGLAKVIKQKKSEDEKEGELERGLVLHYDEFKSFVDKGKIENSVLTPLVSTLFESGDYDNVTKDREIQVRGASLSLVAACTKETYATMFDGRFRDIGLLNRLWLVTDHTEQQIPVPNRIPEEQLETLRERTKALLRRIRADFINNFSRPVAYKLTPGARQMFEEWYRSRKGSPFEKRLDTYGFRLALLLAITTGKTEIDEEVMEATLTLLRWQLRVRRECDPIDTEGQVGAMEEKIRRVLTNAGGSLSYRELKRRCHATRFSSWVWRSALGNLIKEEEVRWRGLTKRKSKVELVDPEGGNGTISVTTPFSELTP